VTTRRGTASTSLSTRSSFGAATRSTEIGAVDINKRVVEEEQTLDVPTTREEVDVRRVRVDRAAMDGDTAFQDGDSIRVPLRAETVEELEITKRPVTETQRVSETVRRETVDVDQEGAVRREDG
jgi:uncharacterized protein (TIGR02271 family)